MKSSFLLTVFLTFTLSTVASGQTNKRKVTPRAKTPTKANVPQRVQTKTTKAMTTKAVAEKSHFDKFYERLSIGYFGVLTSPNLKDLKSRHAGISPQWGRGEYGCEGSCDSYAANIWSQVGFVYNYGGTMSFAILPRWTTWLGTPRGESTQPNSDIFILEDTLVGFQGVVWASANKKFDWWLRPAMRLPMSRGSRYDNRPGFGTLSQQLEALGAFTFHVNSRLDLGLMHQQRFWNYGDRYTYNRLRNYFAPFVTYAIDDKTKFQTYYELIVQTGAPGVGIGPAPTSGPMYTARRWNALMVGVARDITPKLNIYPYLTTFLDGPGSIGPGNMFIGAWIAYKIK